MLPYSSIFTYSKYLYKGKMQQSCLQNLLKWRNVAALASYVFCELSAFRIFFCNESAVCLHSLLSTWSRKNANNSDVVLLWNGWQSLLGAWHTFLAGQEPWPSGYGRQLMSERLWVRIPALYTGWTLHFSRLFVVKIVLFVWKDRTRPGLNHFLLFLLVNLFVTLCKQIGVIRW